VRPFSVAGSDPPPLDGRSILPIGLIAVSTRTRTLMLSINQKGNVTGSGNEDRGTVVLRQLEKGECVTRRGATEASL
jgi:hypothetical protein